MKNMSEILKATTRTVTIMGLYLSSAFIGIEFIFLLLTYRLPMGSALKPLALSIILLILSYLVKLLNPIKFAKTRVFSWLSMFFSISLSIYLITLIDKEFNATLRLAVSSFESDSRIEFVRSLSFLGMSVFILLAIPLAYLTTFWENANNIIRAISKVLFWFVAVFILYIILKYGIGEWETALVDKGVFPFVQFLTGSLSLGWFYELFIGSIDKPGWDLENAKKKLF